jgi:hypothetical protein
MANCGIDADVKFDPVKGWCDFKNGASCNSVSNGTVTSGQQCSASTSIVEDMNGFTKG